MSSSICKCILARFLFKISLLFCVCLFSFSHSPGIHHHFCGMELSIFQVADKRLKCSLFEIEAKRRNDVTATMRQVDSLLFFFFFFILFFGVVTHLSRDKQSKRRTCVERSIAWHVIKNNETGMQLRSESQRTSDFKNPIFFFTHQNWIGKILNF